MSANLNQLHKLVWDFREEAQSWWATPHFALACRYAFSEMGEAVDAWIRLNETGQSRNNEREADLFGELADTAIMLLSAVRTPDFQYGTTNLPAYTDIDEIARLVARATVEVVRSQSAIERALRAISAYPGMELEREISRRLDRIRERHAPK